MDQRPPASSLHASGEEGLAAWNVSRLAWFERQRRQLLQLSPSVEEEPYFVDYKPPARDAITLPRNVVYVLLGVVVVIMATYAIVGHLIKDLVHDLADCILGPKPREDDAQDEEDQDGGEGSSIEPTKYRLEMIEEEEEEEEDERKILLWVEEEEGLLLQPPTPPPPLRSAIASCPAGEKRTSVTHNVTFACPTIPYVTSL